MTLLTRRAALAGAGALLAGGCTPFGDNETVARILASAEGLTKASQRLITSRDALAREFTAADLSPTFKANGTTEPTGDDYARLTANSFSDWTLVVDGLVARPAKFTLAELKAMPARTQITRHDCVEGWSAIGKWTGPQLGPILKSVGLTTNARFLVFHCMDDMGGSLGGPELYYESIDLIDAFHPQTILAHTMNDGALAVQHGAPLRLRVERQLGYKHAKYINRIEAVASFAEMRGGKGGYWEDTGYEWYAGI